MKQFVLNRNRLVPRMEEVPTEKIPIYANETAAEAALSNHNVGDILATRDETNLLQTFQDMIDNAMQRLEASAEPIGTIHPFWGDPTYRYVIDDVISARIALLEPVTDTNEALETGEYIQMDASFYVMLDDTTYENDGLFLWRNNQNKMQCCISNTGSESWSLALANDNAYDRLSDLGENYLFCDGSAFNTIKYPLLYERLGTDHLPDLREMTLVGAGQNARYNIATHLGMTLGDFKDDAIQDHRHNQSMYGSSGVETPDSGGTHIARNDYTTQTAYVRDARTDATTHGKIVAVNFIIKGK